MGRQGWVLDRWTSLCSDLGITSDLSITWGNILRDNYRHTRSFRARLLTVPVVACIRWPVRLPEYAAPVNRAILLALCRQILDSQRYLYAIAWPRKMGTVPTAREGSDGKREGPESAWVWRMNGLTRDKTAEPNSEQGRFYHTLDHVADMLEGADRDFKGIKQPRLVELAIFFHDVVYDPKSSSNEEDSEVMFREFSEAAQMRPVDADTVSNYIIATKQHDVSGTDDPDLRAFIDLDIAVLGREPVAYMVYASQIREEYEHVPTKTYCEKRAEVLRSFLTKPIFTTDIYRRDLEAVARANLEAEIALLSAGTVP